MPRRRDVRPEAQRRRKNEPSTNVLGGRHIKEPMRTAAASIERPADVPLSPCRACGELGRWARVKASGAVVNVLLDAAPHSLGMYELLRDGRRAINLVWANELEPSAGLVGLAGPTAPRSLQGLPWMAEPSRWRFDRRYRRRHDRYGTRG